MARNATGDVVGWPLVEDCLVFGNGVAGNQGAGIQVMGVADGVSKPKIVNTDVTSNTGTSAIFCGVYTLATIEDCDIESNQGATNGAVAITAVGPYGGAHLKRCRIRYNQGRGIMISASSGEYTISDTYVASNNAGAVSGAGIYVYGCNPLIERCLIFDNQTAGDGGGLYVTYASATLNDCLVAGNQGGATGAISATPPRPRSTGARSRTTPAVPGTACRRDRVRSN